VQRRQTAVVPGERDRDRQPGLRHLAPRRPSPATVRARLHQLQRGAAGRCFPRRSRPSRPRRGV